MRSRLSILFSAAALVAAAGCSRPSSAPSTPTFAVVPMGSTHEYWKSVHAGALKAAAEVHVSILWQAPLKEDDREDQIRVVDTVRTRGIQGLAIAPLDDKALRAPVEDVANEGIPVVIFDSPLDSQKPLSLIATDNFKGGQVAGEHMAQLLGGRGRVILLRLNVGVASTTAREEGFLDALKAHPGVTVVSSNQYGGATAEEAYKVSENLLAATRAGAGGVDGIFCPNESTTFGMLRALQNERLTHKIKFIGFDSSDPLVQALSDGEIDALVVQDPVKMGYLSVLALAKALQHQPVDKRIDTGVTLVTRDNVMQPAVHLLVKPDLSILEGK